MVVINSVKSPDVGAMAPDFELKGSTGETMRLSSLRGQKRALLLFYPKDFTSG